MQKMRIEYIGRWIKGLTFQQVSMSCNLGEKPVLTMVADQFDVTRVYQLLQMRSWHLTGLAYWQRLIVLHWILHSAMI